MAVKLIDELQKEIKAAGEAVTQEAYEKAYDHIFQILDNLEKLLNDNRYLERNEITEEDKRLYDILIRFDAAYYFKQRLKAANEGYTMLLVSHEMNFVKNVATRVIFLENGKIIEDGPPKEVFNHPKSDRVREFFAKINRMVEPEYSI